MQRLKALGPRIGTLDTRRVQPAARQIDRELLTSQYRTWRREVMRRAGNRCQWVEGGVRCGRAAPAHRLFADHIVERKDGGALFDPSNGQCLCGRHHTLKTAAERTKRRDQPV